jgi:Lrp/AsnC family transcriptional regulator, leucine-responsive regulatory protein
MALDEVDQKILQCLVQDGRMSLAALGRVVNLSTPAVHYRVRALERSGVISGYSARVDPAAIGGGLSGLVAVEMSGGLDAIERELRRMPEIEACWSTAGTSDLLLRVRTANPAAMERLLVRIRALNGVERTRTTVLLAVRFEREPDPAALVAGAAGEDAHLAALLTRREFDG